jgi:hypothetical protein
VAQKIACVDEEDKRGVADLAKMIKMEPWDVGWLGGG